MLFTTQVFLFIFFPVCMLAYFIVDRAEHLGERIGGFFKRIRLKDLTLIALSIGFYMWSCFDDGFRLLRYITVVYLFGLWIQTSLKKGLYVSIKKKSDGEGEVEHKRIFVAVVPCVIAVAALLIYLVYYKYSGNFIEMWNKVFTVELGMNPLLSLLGLSFITFSSISYLVDVYRGKATAGSWIDCALYISFFPKIVSGPIVLWQDFQKQIRTRKSTLSLNVEGINRIIIGFAKKVILADTFGACIASIGTENIDRVTAFGSLVLYMLQIYYDFAGYSDIALGLSKIFGFEFKENFNFPYRSTSISEFWRRWHISLGTWFREYVYFPCGGSRLGLLKTLRNLMIVFLLTGVWHGAGRNYLVWGIANGVIVVIERILQDKKIYKMIPKFIKWIGTMVAVFLLWNFFQFPGTKEIKAFWDIILGKVEFEHIYYTWMHYFDTRMIVFMIVGFLGATLLGSKKLKELYQRIVSNKWAYLIQELALMALFVVAILFIVNSTYSPFISFQY